MKIPKLGTGQKSFLIGMGLTILMLLLRVLGMFEGVQLRCLDFLFWARGPIEPKARVVIVAIDNESFNEMPERWVWPRTFHAKLITQVMKGKPKAIVFDVLFTEPTTSDRGVQDTVLADACRRSGDVILGAEIVHVRDKQYEYIEFKQPFDKLRKSAYGIGVVNTPRDSDGFVRKGQLVWKVHDERHFSLALMALRKYLGIGKGEINYDVDALEFGDIRIPLDVTGKMLVNFCGPAKTFQTVPYYQVYQGIVDPEIFKDAIVFIGATAEDLHDTFQTPFTWDPFGGTAIADAMPGVEIHANAIDTILTQRFIREKAAWSVFLQFVLGFLISYFAIRARIWVSLVASIVVSVGTVVLSVYLFVANSQFLEFMNPLNTLLLVFLGCTVYRAAVEMAEKQRVRATFARYVSPHVLTTVLTHPPALGGARRVATVLFSDVRGFTSMSEKLTASEVVAILNEYLTEMVDVVLQHDGTLDKFVGDAVMAVFGSPMDQPDHPIRAVSTAWHMSERHNALKEKWIREGKTPFEIGIGLNTGEVVAGNMGSPNRMEFTVIGDNVNTAARLESATKELQSKILISGTTYDQVKDHVEVKEHEPIKVKGKAEPIRVYQLLGVDEEISRSLQKVETGKKKKR